MIRANFSRSAISHGLSLLLGMGGAVFFGSPFGKSPTVASSGHHEPSRERHRPAAGQHLSSTTAFRLAYEQLATRLMTADERQELRDRLFYEWAERDPVGLLAFLERKRVWPYQYELGNSFSDLNLQDCRLMWDRPDLVLDFAIRSGCVDAIELIDWAIRMEKNGDSDSVIRLIDALLPTHGGPAILQLRDGISVMMGRNGLQITNPNANYLKGKAEALLYDDGRIDEFFDTFGKIDSTSIRRSLAHSLGYSLANERPDNKVLEHILRLPHEYRESAVYGMFLHAEDATMRFPEVRETRRKWIEKFVELGFTTGAKEGLGDLIEADDDARANKELAEWVGGFPSGDSWKPIIEEVARRWSNHDQQSMIREVSAMPQGSARSMLAASLGTELLVPEKTSEPSVNQDPSEEPTQQTREAE